MGSFLCIFSQEILILVIQSYWINMSLKQHALNCQISIQRSFKQLRPYRGTHLQCKRSVNSSIFSKRGWWLSTDLLSKLGQQRYTQSVISLVIGHLPLWTTDLVSLLIKLCKRYLHWSYSNPRSALKCPVILSVLTLFLWREQSVQMTAWILGNTFSNITIWTNI